MVLNSSPIRLALLISISLRDRGEEGRGEGGKRQQGGGAGRKGKHTGSNRRGGNPDGVRLKDGDRDGREGGDNEEAGRRRGMQMKTAMVTGRKTGRHGTGKTRGAKTERRDGKT